MVAGRLRALFLEIRATALVSSAASGADLIAQDVGRALDLRRRIVLPFQASRFRNASVTDRPGGWGPLFDRLISEAAATDDIVVLEAEGVDAAHVVANRVILDEAERLAEQLGIVAAAMMVWDGYSRGSDDLTAQFGELALRRRLRVFQIATV